MYRILYVDDEPDLLEIGKIFLESNGTFAVDTLLSPVEAFEAMAVRQYDAIVSDYQMPVMDGITFLKKLRSNGDQTPFIIFTGRGREEVVIEALNSGADFYIQKGGDPTPQFAELTHKIRHAIQRRLSDLAFRKSERHYRHLIESANEAIYVIQDELMKMVNPQAIEISGYPEQEMLNQPFITFAHPDDRGMLLDRFRKRIAGDDVTSRYSFRLLRKDGTVRWVELSVVAIVWDEHPATLNFVIDITDRKRAEDALRESEERYRQFFRTTREAVFITTPGGGWVDFNDALVEVFGYAGRDEVSRIPVSSTYEHQEDRAVFLERIVREGYVKEYPVRLRKKDGAAFNALITAVPQLNPDGSVRSFIGTFRDITDRKRAEEELRTREERYRLFFKTTLDAVFITAPDGRFIDFNDALMVTVGAATRGDIFATNVIASYAHPEERDGFLAMVRRDGYVREHPIRFRRLDGTVFDALITIVPQKNPDGSIRAYIGTVRDLTGRKEAAA